MPGNGAITFFFYFAAKFLRLPIMSSSSNKKGYRNAIAILSTFDKKEQKKLMWFLDSPYCTEWPADHLCPRLIRVLLRLVQKNDPLLQDDAHIYGLMGVDQPFSQTKYDRLMSDAQSTLKKFIIIEQVSEAFEGKMGLLYQAQYWRKKKEREMFEKLTEHLGKQQKQRDQWEGKDYYWDYLVEAELVEFKNEFNQHKSDVNLSAAIKSLDEFYLVERMFVTCCLLTQYQVTELGLPDPLFPVDVEKFPKFLELPLGKLLHNMMICANPLTEDTSPVFGDTLALLEQHGHTLSDKYINQFEFIIGNYLTRQINRGNNQHQRSLFELFKRRVATGRVYHQDKIMANEFQGIVAIALKMREFIWVEKFIEEHKTRITGASHPENAYWYNYCDYLFHSYCYAEEADKSKKKGQLKTILPRINQTQYQDMHYKRAARVLEIKTIYEEDPVKEFEFLFDKIQALRTFISRDEYLPAEKKEGYNLFAKAVGALSKTQVEPKINHLQLKALAEEILTAKFVVGKEWLIEKIDLLMAPPKKPF